MTVLSLDYKSTTIGNRKANEKFLKKQLLLYVIIKLHNSQNLHGVLTNQIFIS